VVGVLLLLPLLVDEGDGAMVVKDNDAAAAAPSLVVGVDAGLESNDPTPTLGSRLGVRDDEGLGAGVAFNEDGAAATAGTMGGYTCTWFKRKSPVPEYMMRTKRARGGWLLELTDAEEDASTTQRSTPPTASRGCAG